MGLIADRPAPNAWYLQENLGIYGFYTVNSILYSHAPISRN